MSFSNEKFQKRIYRKENEYMNVLWVVNTLLNDIKNYLGISNVYGGGWMEAYLSQLKKYNIEISIVTSYDCDEVKKIEVDNINYYLIPGGELVKLGKKEVPEDIWGQVLQNTNPDIIHIHGTEYAHSISLFNVRGEIPIVTSIQGLLSIYERYYFGGIDKKTILKFTAIKDVLRNNTILSQKKDFRRRSSFEKIIIKKSDAIIGRTDWDFSNIKEIKNNCKYYKCNESLRKHFYLADKWDVSNVEKNSIFLSQATYPIKGFHFLIKAMNLLRNDFPNIKLYVAGSDIYSTSKFLRTNSYARYIKRLIEDYSLKDNIEFLGVLDEKQMAMILKKVNVFVQSSAIENSPNALGEAQLIGTPCISSFVGGVSNMIDHRFSGLLYNYQEYAVLANYISEIFNDDKFAETLSRNGINNASKRHDEVTNGTQLINIYNNIIDYNKHTKY